MSFFTNLFKPKPTLQDAIIEMKLAAKQMASASRKCEKNETKARSLVKKAVEKGDIDSARVYAENALREKNQANKYLAMQARLDAVGQRIEAAMRAKECAAALSKVSAGIGTSLQAMDVEQITRTMDAFETVFEDVDTRTGYMESAMEATTGSLTPADSVNALLQEVADEHGLDVAFAIDDAGMVGARVPGASAEIAAKPASAPQVARAS
jgi:charged multivesicular body protein 1